MEKFLPLLLDVWREACRHIAINESVDRIATLLSQRLPVALVLVRRLHVQDLSLRTVAVGYCLPDRRLPPSPVASTNSELERMLVWCREGNIVRGRVAELQKRLPGFFTEFGSAQIMAGPLNHNGEPIGIVILVARDLQEFSREHEPILQALLEPFTAALENDRQLRELSQLRETAEADRQKLLTRLDRQDISDSIIGAETGLRAVMEQAKQVAQSEAPVLILGETGSGKEVVARAIHYLSRQRQGPFMRVNCGAIPTELIDSELFGHERGSFTGAISMKKGWFERADGGTLFLDEVGELPLAAQVRLLRVLQDGSFERVGGERQVNVDVRVVAATNRDLKKMVADQLFREDLWFRIAVFIIKLPPLRERLQDIPLLATHFALQAGKRLGTPSLAPTTDDIHALLAYSWPGNVRELSSVIERAVILGNGRCLEVQKALGIIPEYAPSSLSLQGPIAAGAAKGRGVEPIEVAMKVHIEAALAATGGRVEGPHGAAVMLGVNPNTLRARMRKLAIEWRRFRREGS